MTYVLYLHGMGGGSDSRIPSILNEEFAYRDDLKIVARTYDFDPEIAAAQVAEWVQELKPSMVIGESLGTLHALRLRGIPHLFVSPAINAQFFLELMAWASLIPGVTCLLDKIYKPREGDRQPLHFTFRTLRKYRHHKKAAFAGLKDDDDIFYAFFGTRDHYRRSGVVSVRAWRRLFGNSYTMYDGTHFMEEEYVRTMLVDKIKEFFPDKL